MPNYQNLRYEKRDSGVLITLNRPGVLNAMNDALRDELDTALAAARTDPEIRAVVLTGAAGVFSSGADISDITQRDIAWPYGIPENTALVDEYDRRREAARRNQMVRQLYRWEFPKPIIAAVSGYCLGAASWLALTCHMVIAADDAVFGQPQVRHGGGTDFIWVHLAGFKNALRYALTGDSLDAQEALRIRLVHKVVPKDGLLDETFAIVKRIALVPPETVKINLQKATLGLEMMGLMKAWELNAELTAMAELSNEEDFGKKLEEAKKQGGVKAFFEVRDAPFKNNG